METPVTYIVAMLRLPKADILGGEADDITFGVDDAGTGTTSTDVDADVMVHLYLQLLPRVRGGLSGALAMMG